jgi:hypothetical protein
MRGLGRKKGLYFRLHKDASDLVMASLCLFEAMIGWSEGVCGDEPTLWVRAQECSPSICT